MNLELWVELKIFSIQCGIETIRFGNGKIKLIFHPPIFFSSKKLVFPYQMITPPAMFFQRVRDIFLKYCGSQTIESTTREDIYIFCHKSGLFYKSIMDNTHFRGINIYKKFPRIVKMSNFLNSSKLFSVESSKM